jgi:hypothetical protein
MTKTKNADGSITYTTPDGKTYRQKAEYIAKHGEAAVDASMSYTPSPYAHPAEYAHMYDKKAHEED